MMAPEKVGELTPTEYIQHHLKNLTHSFGEGSFMTLHVDTFITAVLMGLLMVFMFWLAVRKPTAGVRHRLGRLGPAQCGGQAFFWSRASYVVGIHLA